MILCRVREIILAVVVAVLTISLVSANDSRPQAEILHWWATEGEAAALSVFIKEFESRGGHYYDSGNDNETANREQAIKRMGNGYPATLTQWNAGNDLTELYDFGLINPIRDRKILEKLRKNLPVPVLEAVSHRDEIIAIPLNIHSENWIWYSRQHLGQSDLDLSGSWTSFLQMGEVLAEKGIPLLAVGNQRWQIRILFSSVFLGVSRDRYKEFYLENNADVVDSDEFISTLQVFNKLAGYSHSFGDNNWNTQIRAVAENRAASNFMGDWAKSEFSSSGLQPGEDYGCQLTSTTNPSVLMAVDALVLGKVEEQSEIAGQRLMLDIVSDPDINAQFNSLKGSVSPYANSDPSQMDYCSKQVYALLDEEESIIPPYPSYFVGVGRAAELVDHVIQEFWIASVKADVSSSELIAQTQEKFRAILEDISGSSTQTATSED